jgi:hypothetical protein
VVFAHFLKRVASIVVQEGIMFDAKYNHILDHFALRFGLTLFVFTAWVAAVAGALSV